MKLQIVRRGFWLAALFATGCAAQKEAAKKPAPHKDLPALMGDRSPRPVERSVTPSAVAAKGTVAITGATLLLGTGKRIEGGTLIFTDGTITAVGPSASVKVPKGAKVVDGRGKFVTPGIIDTHSHMGVYSVPHVDASADGNEMTDPTTPYVFSEHAFWPQDPAIRHAVAGGVTTIQVLPGSGNIIGGRATTLKLRPQIEARAMRFPGAPFGLKMACGENPKRVYGKKGRQPMSRMGSIAKLRQAFIKARQYRFDRNAFNTKYAAWKKKYDAYQAEEKDAKDPKDEPRRGDRNLGMETLADVLDGKIKVHIHCYRADEMLLMISLADELGYKISSFHHAVEAYKIADVLAAREVGASMWADWWGFKLEAYDGIEENAAMLAAAGGRAIIHSDSNIGIQRLNQEAAKAMHSGRRAGLGVGEDDAIRWITLNPAWALGIDAKTGSLEVGKMADIVVWDANPLSMYATAQQTFIDGARVFDRDLDDSSWSDFEVGTRMREVAP